MSSRSLNRVQLIGNLTRDPELRYTPQGAAVCTLGIATNRSWTTETGERKEEAEFHRIVAWNKLAEICSQYLNKGSRVFVEGRLRTRQWTTQDGNPRQTTEIVISEMIILSSRRGDGQFEEFPAEEKGAKQEAPVGKTGGKATGLSAKKSSPSDKKKKKKPVTDQKDQDKFSEDEIPF